ncbi:MAG: peptidylprolyl isomerase [Cyclobacteriaceae bacterium]
MIFFVATAQSRERSQTLFTINKKAVPAEEFIYLYCKNHQHKPEEFTKEKIGEYLNLFINYKLKVEEAFSRGMDTTSAFKKEYQTYRDELLKPYLPDSKVVDSLVSLTYGRLKEEVNASHILIALKPGASPQDTLEAFKKITDLRMRALDGENFDELAAANSQEPGAEVTKGNLGFFTAMQMVFPFEQAAYLTPVGGISQPVRTQFGYHILKVLDRQPSRGEVEISHIMIRTGDGVNNDEAKNRIFDIYEQLQKGMNWEEFCRQFSEDPNSKDKGGKLRPFGVGAMASVPEFQEMAFSLQKEGDISDPVETQYGWHILRLESRISLPPFDELKASLTQRVSRDERVRISRQAIRERMRNEFGYIENSPAKAKIFAMADSILQKKPSGETSLQEEVLFTMQNQPYRVKDFVAYVSEQPAHNATDPQQYLDQLLVQYADVVQLQLMEEKVKVESPDYKWLLKEYYEGILLFEIMEKEVWNKAMEDTTGQRNYFRAHVSDYKAGERMVGKIYSSNTKAHMENLKDLFESQDPGFNEFVTTNRVRQDSGSFENHDRAIFSKISWSPGIYLTDNNGQYHLVHIEKILPPGPETFQEARPSVISDYQTYLENSWISELKRKFGVKVEKRAKKLAFERLMGNNGLKNSK